VHILWLKTELLHPVDKGGRIRTYNMLRELRRRHRVTYLTLDDGDAAPDAVERAQEYCTDLVRVPFRTAPKRSARFFGELAANVVSSLPYAVAKYRSAGMRRQVERIVGRGDVDVLVCDFLAPSLNVPDGLSCPTVLFQHNVEAMIWQRHTEIAQHPVKRRYMGEQWRRMRAFEAAECRRFDRVIAVSEQDRDVFARDYGVGDPVAVPTGVDVRYFDPGAVPPTARSASELVFTGSMDWLPNEDAILWFVGEILPRVRTAVPDATLTVVGRNPTPRIVELGKRELGVRVTGGVPDVRPYLARGAAFVVPIRIGGGTRLKIYEAMAMELPVVSTTVGAEGLPVEPDREFLRGDDPEAFAAAVVRLLRDPNGARALGERAAETVRAQFSWERVTEQFLDACTPAAAVRT
jgi:sugar transferase (PEP-CTERM/EpsH1 system associated)